MRTSNEVTITVSLSDSQAEALTQFLKRVEFSDYRALAVN